MSNLFCSSLRVPTAFKGISPSYLNGRKVCPLGLFDLYLQRFVWFFFWYRSSLHFAKGSLADLPLVVALGFTLAGNGAQKKWWEGLFHHPTAASPSPSSPALLHRQPKPLLCYSYHVGQALVALLCCAASLPNPAISPRPPSKTCACSSVPIHTSNPSHSSPKQSSLNNHKSSAAHSFPCPLLFHPHCFTLCTAADPQP